MGELRKGIETLVKKIDAIKEVAKGLKDWVTECRTKLSTVGEKAYQGYELLYLSLTASYKRRFIDIEHWPKQPLTDAEDPGAKQLVQGINSMRATLRAHVAESKSDLNAVTKQCSVVVKEALAECQRLVKVAEKKKAALLKSKAYKDKIKGYLADLAECNAGLGRADELIKRSIARLWGYDYLDDYYPEVTLATTIGELKAMIEKGDALKQLAEYQKDCKSQDDYIQSWRDKVVPLGLQLKELRKFALEADAMEKESEG